MFLSTLIKKSYCFIKSILNLILIFIVSIFSKLNMKKKKVENIKIEKPLPTMDDLDKKIEAIKIKNEEHELNVRKYEHEMKIIEAYNKQFEYKIKLVETKGKILNDCLTIIKDVMKDVKCLET